MTDYLRVLCAHALDSSYDPLSPETEVPKLARALLKALGVIEAARRASYHECSPLNLSCAHCAVDESLKAFDEAVK